MYDKAKLIDAIWQEPAKATGLNFVYRGNTWQSRQRPDGTDSSRNDKTVLRRKADGSNIFVNYNGGSFKSMDIWELLAYIYGTNDYNEVFSRTGEAYGIAPEADSIHTVAQYHAKAAEQQIIDHIAAIVTAALMTDNGTEARTYLDGRNLKPTARMGAFGSDIRSQLFTSIQQTWPALTADQINTYLRKFFPTVKKDHTNNPAGEWIDFVDNYKLGGPYFNGGRVTGFWLRQTAPGTLTYKDKDGEVQTLPKYLYSRERPKGGYCDRLRHDMPVILCEGLLDAEAMKQAAETEQQQHGEDADRTILAFANVMALGGMTPTDSEEADKNQIKTLQRYGIKHIIYLPDYEKDKAGNVSTAATQRTIDVLRPHVTGRFDGSGFVSVKIAQLYDTNRADIQKADADSFIREQGADALANVIDKAEQWYYWEMAQAVRTMKDNPEDLAAAVIDVYCKIDNPIDREQLRNFITSAPSGSAFDLIRKAGVTASALSMIDKNGSASSYRSRIADAQADLNKAVEQHASAERIGECIDRLQAAQNYDANKAFAAQVNATPEQIHTAIATHPAALETRWQMYGEVVRKGIGSTVEAIRPLSFQPAEISIFAAPTNHGKTLFMLQAALNAAKDTGKHVIYVSIENTAEQMYIRTLTAHIGPNWPASEDHPKKAVKDYIRGSSDMPEMFANGKTTDSIIEAGIADYWRTVAPRLHLLRTGSDCGALCSSIASTVEEWRNKGEQTAAVFIDYIQLLHVSGRSYSRTDELKAVCDRLNDLAESTGLPIICGAQLNRSATANNGDKIDGITLANIGESSGIEFIAGEVFFAWRTDKIEAKDYTNGTGTFEVKKTARRSLRLFKDSSDYNSLYKHMLYIENLKSREYDTGGYCLIPTYFSTGHMADESEKGRI